MKGTIDRLNADAIGAPAMMSIPEFCEAHRISRAFFYKLHKDGKAPPICKLGARSLISAEAAAEWRRGLEREAA